MRQAKLSSHVQQRTSHKQKEVGRETCDPCASNPVLTRAPYYCLVPKMSSIMQTS